MDIPFFETSAKNSVNVDLAFTTLITDIMNRIVKDSAENSKVDIKIKKKKKESNSCCVIS